MSLVILDMGSGNSCKNDVDYAKCMIDTVAAVDSHKHNVILKWQLEDKDPPGQKRLDRAVFTLAYEYATEKNYLTTSSVFDYKSLAFLLQFPNIPFVKIACDPKLYGMALGIPARIPVFISVAGRAVLPIHCNFLHCVPKYPATLEEYEAMFHPTMLKASVSDHSPGLELWEKYQPQIFEKHLVLEREENNPDAGPFAITPDQLREVIG